jgi:hypothetical protein
MRPATPSHPTRFSGTTATLRLRQRGSALLAALCFATVLGIALSSYLSLCYRTLELSSRGMTSLQSVQLAEAGMERALWALNNNDWEGWTISGTTATRTLTGFTFSNGITGRISLSITSYNGAAGERTVTATGITTRDDGTETQRTLTCGSALAPLFVNAVAATTGRVRFLSAGTVDSYDSSVADYSSNAAGYSAIISSGSTITTAATVQLTNAQVKGYVATLGTGPSYSTSARLLGPTTMSGTLIDTTRLSTSPYQPLFEPNPPTGTSTTLPIGTAWIGTPGTTKYYTATDVALGSDQWLVIDGPVVLDVTGNLSTANNGCIIITSNGSLEIHLGGNLTLDGGGIANTTKAPRKLAIIAKTTNPYDTLTMGSTTPFYGVFYTPNNALAFNNNVTIYGAVVAKWVTFTASPAIHYDLDLRRRTFPGLVTPFAISNWRETQAD